MRRIVRRTLVMAVTVAVVAGCASAAQTQQSGAYAPSRFSVEVAGQGPDVILIPGLASSRDVWDAALVQLSATHRVHVLQLAGFAGEPTGVVSDGEVVHPFVHDLHRYIEANRIVRPVVIGHSLGGLSALMLARHHPESVGRVMVVDALPFFSLLIDASATEESMARQAAAARDAMLAMSPEQFAAGQTVTMNRLVRTQALRPAVVGWSLASDRSVMARAMYEVMTTDLRGDLASIQTPVTIVYAYDPAMGPEPAITGLYTNLYAPLPNHHLVRIDQSYHFIPLDQPEAFAAAVDEFLR
ncbi:MAG TPA: alpha/beta hydrolase [Hyphomonadaceae bacterium]|nr:alpha/beta hydrolase [Hyphomonadaceae bacterium]